MKKAKEPWGNMMLSGNYQGPASWQWWCEDMGSNQDGACPQFPRKHAHDNKSSCIWSTYYMLGIVLGVLYTFTFNLCKNLLNTPGSGLDKIWPCIVCLLISALYAIAAIAVQDFKIHSACRTVIVVIKWYKVGKNTWRTRKCFLYKALFL